MNREQYYIDKLLDLAFEFRDDEALCNKECNHCKLYTELKIADEKITICHMFAYLCNNEDELSIGIKKGVE